MRTLLLVLAAAFASHALAQEAFPGRTIRVVVPFTPGSVTDVMGRSVTDKLSANLGQPVIVENRPGAGGTIGIAQVAKAPP
ncbi:MAG TPA: tripartite tricarboxylate transporter substrate-binding protein, partial [Burkholderiales bacterium]|nr:tripartite tricarboxylate transporter substrate-binding protein [Burkholderiales bacterium]